MGTQIQSQNPSRHRLRLSGRAFAHGQQRSRMPIDRSHSRGPTLHDHSKALADWRHRGQGVNGKKLTANISKSQRINRRARGKPQALTQVGGSVRRSFYSQLEKLFQGRLLNCGKERGENLKGGRVDVDFGVVTGKDRDHFVQASADGQREALDPPQLTKGEQKIVARNRRGCKAEIVDPFGSTWLGKVIAIKPVQQRIKETRIKIAQCKQALRDLAPPTVDRAAGSA